MVQHVWMGTVTALRFGILSLHLLQYVGLVSIVSNFSAGIYLLELYWECIFVMSVLGFKFFFFLPFFVLLFFFSFPGEYEKLCLHDNECWENAKCISLKCDCDVGYYRISSYCRRGKKFIHHFC